MRCFWGGKTGTCQTSTRPHKCKDSRQCFPAEIVDNSAMQRPDKRFIESYDSIKGIRDSRCFMSFDSAVIGMRPWDCWCSACCNAEGKYHGMDSYTHMHAHTHVHTCMQTHAHMYMCAHPHVQVWQGDSMQEPFHNRLRGDVGPANRFGRCPKKHGRCPKGGPCNSRKVKNR